MARTTPPHPDVQSKGPISCGIGIQFNPGTWLFPVAGAPTSGAAGDGAGWAGIGSIVTDTVNGKLYINTGTQASPTWTVVGSQT